MNNFDIHVKFCKSDILQGKKKKGKHLGKYLSTGLLELRVGFMFNFIRNH